MVNRYISIAIASMLVVFGSYVVNFYYKLGYGLSDDVAVWAQLGDYAGGLLNPILSFISLVLLIKSLTLQNEASLDLRKELKINEKTEKLRSFETHFFNMLNSQKVSFDSFKLKFEVDNNFIEKVGVEAVIAIEEHISELLDSSDNYEESISAYLEELDETDKIYSATRIFYIIVKMVNDKLTDEDGFSAQDRKSHLLTLINFTEFSLLRLIMISLQFMDCHPTKYLKSNAEFNAALDEVGIGYDLYKPEK
ncbi:hypothetical protein ACH4OR_000887 [Vibrio cholerae]